MQYAPGDLMAVAGPSALLVLPSSEGFEAARDDIWASVGGSLSFARIVDELFGRSAVFDLGAEPVFVLVCRDGESMRILLRGDLLVRVVRDDVSRDDGARTVRNASVTTWHEEVLSDREHTVIVSSVEVDAAALTGLWPLAAGVVAAGLVRWAYGDRPPPQEPSAPGVSAVAPEPEQTIAPLPAADVVPEPDAVAVPVPEYSVSHRLLFGLSTDAGPGPEPVPAAAPDKPVVVAKPAVPEKTLAPWAGDDDQPTVAPAVQSGDELPQMPADWVKPRAPRAGTAPVRPPGSPARVQQMPGRSPIPARDAPPSGTIPVVAPVAESSPEQRFPSRHWDRGLTTMATPELRRSLLGGQPAPAGDSVLAVRCPAGHLSEPDRSACRVCGQPVRDRSPHPVSRPQLGRLCRQGAPDLPVNGQIVLGRRPEWSEPGLQPLLISVEDPERAVSRSHLSVSVDGWDVKVTDLGTENGTTVQLPTGEILMLRPHEPVTIVPSTTVTLADVVEVWFEVP